VITVTKSIVQSVATQIGSHKVLSLNSFFYKVLMLLTVGIFLQINEFKMFCL